MRTSNTVSPLRQRCRPMDRRGHARMFSWRRRSGQARPFQRQVTHQPSAPRDMAYRVAAPTPRTVTPPQHQLEQ